MLFTKSILTALAAAQLAYGWSRLQTATNSSDSWNLKKFTSFTVFGDSYTDESRLGYFISHNGSAPPIGWVDPESFDASDGGRIWARYVVQYTGVNLYNYAVSGAVCSNDITPRFFSAINAPFPSVREYEIPAFIADSQYVEPNGTKFLDIPTDETVYAMWIGTNDLGYDAFIQDSQINNTTLVDYIDCVFNSFDSLYANGGRYFVLLNVAPLYHAPIYALPSEGGVGPGPNQYWDYKPDNTTEISDRMLEQVVSVNGIYKYELPFEVKLANRYPGAHFALYDVYSLMNDIWNNPQTYLNGSAPLNVTGYENHCNANNTDCVDIGASSPDSFMWYDILHPSEQTDRIIAQNFVDVVRGESQFATYWAS
ncbi:carbohydrate esterase family 16 protein [Viridothelium virens]|uniref:Carbohydrate esterase family 16 protein n=1 Tax=Viridothelium virens TaxID=1048519 RepID=A0A6A6HBR3_VIRVR|nr:carbohydrate esterase family 16 protein [Viridothelium virens]